MSSIFARVSCANFRRASRYDAAVAALDNGLVAVRLLCSRAITYLAKECGALPAGIRTLTGSFTAALTGVNRSADEATARNPAQSLGSRSSDRGTAWDQ